MEYTYIDRYGRERSLMAIRSNEKLVFRLAIIDPTELQNKMWLSEYSGALIDSTYAMCEEAIFDIANGETELVLYEDDMKIYAVNATEEYDLWWSTSIYIALLDRQLWNSIQGELVGLYTGKSYEFGAELLPALTRWPGYERAFYDAIPYIVRHQLCPSHEALSQKIRTPQKAREYFLEESSLACWKSMRTYVFGHPQILFFMKELEDIYQALGNINHLRRLLKNEGIYELLSELHRSPCVKDFLREYAAVEGVDKLTKEIEKDAGDVIAYGKKYLTYSPEMQQRERDKWHNRSIHSLRFERTRLFSVPIKPPPENIFSYYTRHGYTFRPLRNTSECEDVGHALKNCLTEWEPTQNPVVGVYDTSGPVAAIEIDPEDHTIVQVRGKDNKPICSNHDLMVAYDFWLDICEFEPNPMALQPFEDAIEFECI